MTAARLLGCLLALLPARLLAGDPQPAPDPAHAAPAAEAPPPAFQPDIEVSPSEEFERGKTAFGRGEYQRAVEVLRPLLYPDVRLESEGEVVQAHRMLGVAHLFEGQPNEARHEFRKLLELRPDYRFDPLLDPPRVVDFFNQVLRQEEEEISTLEARRKKRDAELALRREREAARLREEQAVVTRVKVHSFAVNFIPFGAGQFQNGQRGKAWTFLGAEALLGGASLAAFVTNFALYGIAPHRRCNVAQPLDANGLPQPCPDNEIDRSDEQLSANLTRLQVASGGLFFAVAIWGVIDAIRNFQSEVQLGQEPATPAPRAGLRPSLRPAALSASLSGVVGAEWRF